MGVDLTGVHALHGGGVTGHSGLEKAGLMSWRPTVGGDGQTVGMGDH
jgi:hypothetical protein